MSAALCVPAVQSLMTRSALSWQELFRSSHDVCSGVLTKRFVSNLRTQIADIYTAKEKRSLSRFSPEGNVFRLPDSLGSRIERLAHAHVQPTKLRGLAMSWIGRHRKESIAPRHFNHVAKIEFRIV